VLPQRLEAKGTFSSFRMLKRSSLMNNCLPRDAFQKREKANEDYAIKQREKEKLLELKKKLADQQQHLKKLEESM
jgi:Mitochondrial ATPase inhibitor, IATP